MSKLDFNLFKLAILGNIIDYICALDTQNEEAQKILRHIGIGFCVCYGKYNENNAFKNHEDCNK